MTDSRIQLANGELFDLLEPDPELIDIETIATSLSKLCRFTGHSREFYSVAQHCVVVSRLVPAELALAGLLHDATEAFVGDVSTPLKALLPEYRAIEDEIEAAIGLRFGTPPPGPEVKEADRMAMSLERRDLGITGNEEYWSGLPEPAREFVIVPHGSELARTTFLARFVEIQLRPGAGQAPLDGLTMHPRAAEQLRQPDPKRFETNEDVSRRLAEAELDSDDGREWTVVG